MKSGSGPYLKEKEMKKAIATAALAIGLAASIFGASAASAGSILSPEVQAAPLMQWNSGTMLKTATGAPIEWMAKANDDTLFPAMWGRWAWMMCGESVVYVGATGTTGPCESGQIHTFGNEAHLEYYMRHSPSGQTIVFDQEYWSLTPLWEQAHPLYYAEKACKLATVLGDKIIFTPYNHWGSTLFGEWRVGARYCWMTEGQLQFADRDPSVFASDVATFIADTGNRPAHIMIGIATDEGGAYTTPSELASDIQILQKRRINHIWMNANIWAPPRGDGTGDASVFTQAMQLLGYTG